MRTSYKWCNDFAKYFNLEVIKHQYLGKNDYYYKYTVVEIVSRNRVLDLSSLKEVKDYLLQLTK